MTAPRTPAEHAEQSRAEQGLPPKVEDPACLARIAALLTPPRDVHGVAAARPAPHGASGTLSKEAS